MKTYWPYILISIFIFSLNAQARKPAVEDFVGVIPKDYKSTPQGTEVLFDFGNKVKKHAQQPIGKIKPMSTPKAPYLNWAGVLGLIAFIALPFFMWFFISRFEVKIVPKHIPSPDGSDHDPHDSSKVTNLDKFREEKSRQDEKKVS